MGEVQGEEALGKPENSNRGMPSGVSLFVYIQFDFSVARRETSLSGRTWTSRLQVEPAALLTSNEFGRQNSGTDGFDEVTTNFAAITVLPKRALILQRRVSLWQASWNSISLSGC